jgi:hypothetical protein
LTRRERRQQRPKHVSERADHRLEQLRQTESGPARPRFPQSGP